MKFNNFTLVYHSYLMPLLTSMITSALFQRLMWVYFVIFPKYKPISLFDNFIEVFISLDDPQSFILIQCLQRLQVTLNNMIFRFIILPENIQPWSQQHEKAARNWIFEDSNLFALEYGMKSPINVTSKSDGFEQYCEQLLRQSNLNNIYDTFVNFYNGIEISVANPNIETQRLLRKNELYLNDLGYYGSGVILFEGEWFQPNRLHHFERKVLEKQCILSHRSRGRFNSNIFNKIWLCYHYLFQTYRRRIFDSKILFSKRLDPISPALSVVKDTTTPIIVYYSFRSPYSQIAIQKLHRLSKHHNIPIVVKVMLPMVMRGLPVPMKKAIFILLDCSKEARLYNIPFGKCCDPIHSSGEPICRALDAFIIAQKYQKELDYILSFSIHVWSRGVDPGSDSGLKMIVEYAGLSWPEVRSAISVPSIRQEWELMTTENREFLVANEFWGVPCIFYKDVKVWGQDQVYKIIQHLKSL